MQKLIQGIHKFQNEVFDSKIELFKKLEQGQTPQVLFITCSDSRMNPIFLDRVTNFFELYWHVWCESMTFLS